MKTQTRKWIGLMMLCPVLLLPGTRVTGQQPKIAQVTIPFQFWIGDNPLPACDYQIEHVVSSTLVLFRSKNGDTVQEAYMIPLDDSLVKPGMPNSYSESRRQALPVRVLGSLRQASVDV